MRLQFGNLEEVEPASLQGLPAALHLLKRWTGEAAGLYEQGQHEEARSLYERALDVDPWHAQTLGTLGALNVQQGRLEEAQPLLEQALKLDPRDVKTLCTLGALHFKQGRCEEARPLWERGLEVDPRHLPSLCYLGDLHLQQGRPEEARRWCEEALAICPESRTAQYVLYKLTRRYGGGTAARFGAAAPPALEIGSVVRVDGLAQRPELNGSHGTVRSFDAEAGR